MPACECWERKLRIDQVIGAAMAVGTLPPNLKAAVGLRLKLNVAVGAWIQRRGDFRRELPQFCLRQQRPLTWAAGVS
jgi:hypothetical protein